MTLTQERLDVLVAGGALIEVIKFHVPVLDIARARVLPGDGPVRYKLRHCCMFPNDGHDVHTLAFDDIQDNGQSILLLDKGKAVAGIAPYLDWPELNVGEYLARRGQWLHLLGGTGSFAERFETFFEEA